MPNKTGIEYVQYTSNPVYAVSVETGKRGWHCVHASPGCENCYAERRNKWIGTGLAFIAQNDEKVRFGISMKEIDALLALDARLFKRGETAGVFVGDMLDIYHRTVPDFLLNELYGALERCTALSVLTLTKRAARQRDFLSKRWAGREPPAHIRVGVSAEDQRRADERVPLLLQTPAAVRWVSAEPLLGPINLQKVCSPHCPQCRGTGEVCNLEDGGYWVGCPCERLAGLSWVVIGGESGGGARTFDVRWASSLVEQCRAAWVPVFVKQLGAHPVDQRGDDPEVPPYEFFFKDRKGGDPSEWPEDLRVRQFPAPTPQGATA